MTAACAASPGRAVPSSAVGLGDALDLVLLLDGVAVGGLLGGVHDLVRQTLGDGLDVAEGAVPGAGGDEVDGLVHAAQRRHVHGLAPHDAGGADARGVLPGAAVLHRIDVDLDGVLVRAGHG